MPIGVRAAKRGLPPIPAFGIGWLYPVCPRRANLAIPRPFFIPPGEVLPHNATETKFPARFAGNWLSVPGLPTGNAAPSDRPSRVCPTGLCAPKKGARSHENSGVRPTYVTELGYLCRRLPNDSVRVSARMISEPVTEPSIRLLTVVLLIAINGFIAGAEVSLLSVRHSRLRQMAEEGNAGAQAALSLLSNPGRLLSVTQVGVTLAS